MTKITDRQREILGRVRDQEVSGVSIQYEGVFMAGAGRVTREVNALRKKGLVEVTWYRGGKAGVNLTDTGRAEAIPLPHEQE